MFLRQQGSGVPSLKTTFFAAALVAQAAVVTVTWALIYERPQADGHRRSRELQATSEAAVKILQGRVDATRRDLAEPDSLVPRLGPDGIIVLFGDDKIDTVPSTPLPFVPDPWVDIGESPPAGTFKKADDLLRIGAVEKALVVLDQLTRSREVAVRAGALLRRARALAMQGRSHHALGDYDSAAQIDGAAIRDFPVDLLAEIERIELRARLGLPTKPEAKAMDNRLLAGEWRISFGTYLQSKQRLTWPGAPSSQGWQMSREGRAARRQSAVGEAAAFPFQDWNSRVRSSGDGASFIRGVDQLPDRTVIHRVFGKRGYALVAGPQFLEAEWMSAVRDLGAKSGASFKLISNWENYPLAATELRARKQDTKLPWDIIVSDVHPKSPSTKAETAAILLGAGLLSVVLASTARGAYREMRKSRLQEAFVAAVAHEFRTPLTSLKQISEILIEGRASDRHQEYFRTLARKTDRLERVTESLLTFARFESGAKVGRTSLLCLNELVSKVCREFSEDSAARGHAVQVSLEPAPKVLGHAGSLETALWNLLDNAGKYSRESSSIAVHLRVEKKHAILSVSDEGPGMPAAERRRAFDRFVRGSSASTAGVPGTGIGLTIVRYVADMHGGAVALEVNQIGGLTASLRLPVAEAS